MSLIYILILVLLLFLNAFFVVAEFAAVRVRGTQIAALKDKGQNVSVLDHIHTHLDEYLAVCQLGITFTSVGLGFVGEPALAGMLQPYLGHEAAAHAAAISISYVLVSVLHIVLGEQVPKIAAISHPVRSAILVAWPMRMAHRIFYLPLMLLNGLVRLILWPFGVRSVPRDAAPSEAEVRLILEKSQQEGMMPFRRLLLMENVFDFGQVRVRDEMRSLEQATVLYADHPWEENRAKIESTMHTRFPLLEGNPPRALGIVHIKDLARANTAWPEPTDFRTIVHKTFITSPDTPLEQLLTELRRRRIHMALVQDAKGQLCGLITMEDILEQLVGSIEDEFEKEAPLRLGDVLKETRILLDLQATSASDAISEIIRRCGTEDVSMPAQAIIDSVQAREKSLSTYLGEGLAVPHARLDSLKAPVLYFARSGDGVVFDPTLPDEKALGLFLLLSPGSVPRMQIRLLARIAAMRESVYVWDRLINARSTAEALEAIRSGDELTT
jgi:CBS domain containing-hemolysin-like protein/mannitol/fructose-specific phosphotransferase system IIA component (Ntr-type)